MCTALAQTLALCAEPHLGMRSISARVAGRAGTVAAGLPVSQHGETLSGGVAGP